jgi:hypothetical protein
LADSMRLARCAVLLGVVVLIVDVKRSFCTGEKWKKGENEKSDKKVLKTWSSKGGFRPWKGSEAQYEILRGSVFQIIDKKFPRSSLSRFVGF